MMYKNYLAALALAAGSLAAHAQQSSMTPLPLNDLSAFRPQAGNWQIVGEVSMDRNVDSHPQPKVEATPDKKGKKSKTAVAEAPKAVTTKAGTGVLLNLNDETKKDALLTKLEHGDIDLELEVMLPKGSNSGIYLQGRYEVQLFDSWGVKNPKYSDIGGIYRNWENEPGKIYMGKAPLSNPAKAPGLWQTMKISFRAPRFDASGKKIENARFVSVELNGVKIHDQVEVPLPTGGPIENNETPTGPLMIQGDHGPVAIRNVKYRLTSDLSVKLSPIEYKVYKGPFKEVAEFKTPVKTGTSPELTCEVLDDENEYGITYSGTITVPKDDNYHFTLVYTGGLVAQVNGIILVDLQRGDAWESNSKSINLKAGTYPFVIHNFKTASWMPPRLAFGVRTDATSLVKLHAYNSYPPDDNPTSPILIHVGSEPKLLRAFVDFKGDYKKRITHSIGVGDPSGVNYVYDLDGGNVACVWRGDFVDATPMWHDRGDGSFKPLGSTQFTYLNQSMAYLPGANDAFPTMGKEGEFRSKGYRLEEGSGRPIFKYLYNGLEVEERVVPANNAITREVSIKGEVKANLYFKLAEGARIDKMPDGSYAIDQQYYVQSDSPATIREVNGTKELVIAVNGSALKYSIIW
ncbi:MAG: family 16 glycoside hydrolase [Bacteroidota bacterium]